MLTAVEYVITSLSTNSRGFTDDVGMATLPGVVSGFTVAPITELTLSVSTAGTRTVSPLTLTDNIQLH